MIVSCHECIGKVSTKAKTCPHCGAPAKGNDWNSMGEPVEQKRAELDAEGESLATERLTLGKQKSAMAEAVAREMALTFEAFVRDMLKPAAKAAEIEPPKSAAPAPAPKQQDQPRIRTRRRSRTFGSKKQSAVSTPQQTRAVEKNQPPPDSRNGTKQTLCLVQLSPRRGRGTSGRRSRPSP